VPGRADVVVVGAGLAGCIVALLLARAGVRTVVLDARAPGHGATGRSAGFLIRGTADHPDRVAELIGAERMLALWRYTERSIDYLTGLVAELGVDCALRREGGLVLSLDEGEQQSLKRSRDLVDTGEVWSAADVADRTGFQQFSGGWFRPREGMLDPARLCDGLARAATQAGASVLASTRVLGIAGGRPLRIRTDRGEVRAERVVLAVNAALPLVEDLFAVHLYPVRAQMHATAPAQGTTLPWPVYAHHGYEYWRQEPTGELLFGGCRWAEEPARECGVSDDTCVSERIFSAQREFVARHLPGLASLAVTSRWAGIMAFTTDSLPIVGPIEGREDRIVCAGWNGHGLAQAPLSARIVAESILGGRGDDVLPAGLSPARFDVP
jgi:glycine/D-amino acid oxidase-like deaminating enzyme